MSKPKHILCWDTFAKDKQTTRHYFYVGFVPAIELCTNGSQVTFGMSQGLRLDTELHPFPFSRCCFK